MARLLGSVLALLSVLPSSVADPIPTSFEVLAGFDYREGMTLPGEVTELDEETVRVQGFMEREEEGSGKVELFMLINDACGCEGTPKLNEIVFCAMPEGKPTAILPGTVKITGTLYVGEEEEDGEVIGIYWLDVDTIE